MKKLKKIIELVVTGYCMSYDTGSATCYLYVLYFNMMGGVERRS
jgi:hypothetical protein